MKTTTMLGEGCEYVALMLFKYNVITSVHIV